MVVREEDESFMKNKKVRYISIVFILILLFFVGLNVFTSFLSIKSSTEKTIANHTLEVAEELAAQIDREAYERFLINQEKNKDYQDIKLFLNDARKNNGALYISILTIDNPNFAKVMISSVPIDMEAIPTGDKATLPKKQVRQAYEGHSFYTGIINDSTYGDYLIAGAPIINQEGTIIGFLAVDVSADDINTISGKVLKSSSINLAFNGVFVILLLVFFFVMQRWYQKALVKEVGDTEDTYQSEFESLLASVHSLRHDFSNHVLVVHGLLKIGEHDKALDYLTTLSKEIRAITSIQVNVRNPGLSVLLETKKLAAENYNIKMRFEVLDDSFSAIKTTDLIKLSSNIIDNAIEATLELPDLERFVRITCKVEGDQYVFAVTNTGPKISEKNRELIFKRGFSTKKAQKGKIRGQGLYIVRNWFPDIKGKS